MKRKLDDVNFKMQSKVKVLKVLIGLKQNMRKGVRDLDSENKELKET